MVEYCRQFNDGIINPRVSIRRITNVGYSDRAFTNSARTGGSTRGETVTYQRLLCPEPADQPVQVVVTQRLIEEESETTMPPRQPLTEEQRRLLRIIARMPLTSVANLASVIDITEERVRRMLATLKSGGWVESVALGMTERRQHRWFLTRKAVDALYVSDHRHPSPREEARAAGLVEFHPEGELPEDFRERFTLDRAHPAHLENQDSSPFNGAESPVDDESGVDGDGPDHEHPLWTATSRGIETSLRHGGFYHAVARYGNDIWIPFTYAGLHATERVLRRKEQHRFWGLDSYSH